MSYDPKANLQHWPMALSRFGANPYGENLYRCVWAPSRRHIVYGEWPNGERKASWIQKYPEVGNMWVLERWMTPFEYTKMTPEKWNLEMTLLGPYPDRGEYEIAHVFEACLPSDANIEKLISWIEEGRKRTFWETLAHNKEAADKEEESMSEQRKSFIRECLPAFGTAALVGYGGTRGTKTAPILKTAEELGLPTTPNALKSRQIHQPQEFEVNVRL